MSDNRNAKSKAPKGQPSATGREESVLNEVRNPDKENEIADNNGPRVCEVVG